MSENVSYRYVAAVTPNDSADLPNPIKAFFVGVGGNIEIVPYGDGGVSAQAAITIAVIANTVYPIMVRRVRAAGTTASGIVGLW